MYVLITQNVTAGGYYFLQGGVREIPRELYNEQSMTRLGPNLTSAQQSALITWATTAPGSAPLNVE